MSWFTRNRGNGGRDRRGSDPPSVDSPHITIHTGSNGPTASGAPPFLSPTVWQFPERLLCNEGTDLRLYPVSSLVTGVSSVRPYVMQMQIAAAIRAGYTPLVLSSRGKHGEVYPALCEFFKDNGMLYVSDTADSDRFSPLEALPRSEIVDFFIGLLSMTRQQGQDGLLLRSYIDNCLLVFSESPEAARDLMQGTLTHVKLVRALEDMHLAEEEKQARIEAVDAARSVSVAVLSAIQDYLCKLHRSTAQTSGGGDPHAPRITVHRVQGGTARPSGIVIRGGSVNGNSRSVSHGGRGGLSTVAERRCLFLHLDNALQQGFDDRPLLQCFQWYLAQTLRYELRMRPALHHSRILLIVEDVDAAVLEWYKWLLELPACVSLLCYRDIYAQLSVAPDLRQQLLGRTKRVFFFSIANEESAQWASDFFGSRTVPKITRTDLPPNDLWDLVFRKRTMTYDEQDKPWFSKHEIHLLRDKGIVFSLDDRIFKPCYLERGETYRDSSYHGLVNFCTFSFK